MLCISDTTLFPYAALLGTAFKVLFIGIIGLYLIRRVDNALQKFLTSRASIHGKFLIQKMVFYSLLFLLALSLLSELGFNSATILGAIALIGAAVGIAAQTSIANCISGIFLLVEQTCKIGDYIVVGSFSGTVESIDLLSIKIRADNHLLTRIPHEILLTAPVTCRSPLEARYCTLTVICHNIPNTVLYTFLKKCPYILLESGITTHVESLCDGLYSIHYIFWVAPENYAAVNESLIAHIAAFCAQKNIALQELYLNATPTSPQIQLLPSIHAHNKAELEKI